MNVEVQRPRLKRGAFQIYTGEGKGKSTASMGLMLRALGCGFKVYYLRLVKPRWKTGEVLICPGLHPNLTFRNVEQDWILSKSRHIPEHVFAMRGALATEMDDLERIVVSAEYDLVIVDEINYCIYRELIPLERALKLVDNRPQTVELVFTGRYAADALIDRAGVVTEMRKIKHHFDEGVTARRGIEF
ncbi:MAG TPA: cob(I)yrinic acid a,c-diamide adenosyltransferase [Chthoniobacterales bacterium]|nr:cob(I)yrinic acid a,c-diamide adenosyltransferase [Chthoniobacterales bacterium]